MIEVRAKAAPEEPGVLRLVLLVTAAATATIVAAAVSFAQTDFSPSLLAGLLALFAAATFTEALPSAHTRDSDRADLLASVFLIGAVVLYGWAPATLLAFLMQLTVETGRRRPLLRIAYNSSVYALAAAAGGAAAAAAAQLPLDPMLTETPAAAAAFYAVDLILVALIVARARREPFVAAAGKDDRDDEPSAHAHGLSERRPGRALGPVTVSDRGTLRPAHRVQPLPALAAADAGVTAHRSHRSAHRPRQPPPVRRRINDEVPPTDRGSPVSVCILDVDGLKRINDSYGHPLGDRLLTAVGARLAASGEAFRLGGDGSRCSCRGSSRNRLGCSSELVLVDLVLDGGHDEPVNISAGIAAYPRDGETPPVLVDRADEALYFSKRHAPGSVSAHSAGGLGLQAHAADSPPDRAMRLQAATSLARGVDSRCARGSHSQPVGSLAARIGARMGWEAEQCKLLELAGRLHDLGKVGIPAEVLEKDGPLAPDERRVVERHPAIGSNMLTSLRLGAVSGWVLHHHESWDGTGYPDRLAGEAIPLAARIVAVADAFDALTSDRVYRGRLTDSDALDELERAAGTQFDPNVVAALVAELADPEYDL